MAGTLGEPTHKPKSKKKRKQRLLSETPHPRLNNRMLEVLAYGLLILLLGLWQMAPRGWPVIFGGRPLLLVPLVTCIAMFAGPLGGAAAGVGAGLLWDLYSATRLFGFNALILMILGCAIGLLVRLLVRNNALSALLLMSGTVLAQAIFDWLCNYLLPGQNGALRLLLHTIAPNVLYTLVLSLPVYGMVRGVTKWLKKRTRG